MTRGNKIRTVIDVAMAAAVLLLMAYALVGEFAHECIGALTGMLFIMHLWLNRRRIATLPRGRWTAPRALETAVTLALALAIVVTMVTGITTSRYLFTTLAKPLSTPFLETAHMTAAHWAFVLAGIHLGLHWRQVVSTISHPKGLSAAGTAVPPASRAMRGLKALCALVFMAMCVAAFMDRGIWRYLLGLNHFALMDFAEPVWHCVAEYLLSAALFVGIGRIVGGIAGRFAKRRKPKNGITAK